MKTKYALLMYALCLVMVLASCGSSNDLPAVDTDTPKTSEDLASIRDNIGDAVEVTRSSGMNEKELLAAINESSDFFTWFAPDAGFVASSLEINQRDTEKKGSDEIYATVTSINEYSSYAAEFYLYLKYYKEGGWRLESITQNDTGIYQINYWPQEEDLYAVWDNHYTEMYNNGVISACEVENTGDDYITYLVTYYRSSELAFEFAWAEVQFRFESGLWTTVSMGYPAAHVFKLYDSNALCHTYLIKDTHDDGMNVTLINLYTDESSDTRSTDLRADWYEYYVDTASYYADFTAYENRGASFSLNSISIPFGGYHKTLYYDDGSLRNDTYALLERIGDTSNTPLSKTDAQAMIQQLVEANGFPYWTDYESAQRAQGQDRLQDLNQNVDLTPYRQVCIEYYGQFDLTFPDDLDPCMYQFYINTMDGLDEDMRIEITDNAPYPLDYMDSSVYDWLSYAYYGY